MKESLPIIDRVYGRWGLCPATCRGEHSVLMDNDDAIVKHSDGQIAMVMPAAAYTKFVKWCEDHRE